MNINDNDNGNMSDKLSKVYRTDPFGFPLHAADEAIFQNLSKKDANPETSLSNDAADLEIISKAQQNEAIDTPRAEIMDGGDAAL